MIFDKEVFFSSLPQTGRLLGLDVGTKTIGVATCDNKRIISSPHSTIKRKTLKIDVISVLNLTTIENIKGIVVGWPLNMDGSIGSQCKFVENFVTQIKTDSKNIPILMWDERLSTAAVDKVLIEAGTRRAKRKEVIDGVAASYILQGALDFFQKLENLAKPSSP